jgi:predicted DNA-binding antitoxin AbrB/MazE fold protein
MARVLEGRNPARVHLYNDIGKEAPMTQTCEAIYENGLFRPLAPAPEGLSEGQKVRLVVEAKPVDVIDLAVHVYDGLSEEDIDEIERIALDRSNFFSGREL